MSAHGGPVYLARQCAGGWWEVIDRRGDERAAVFSPDAWDDAEKAAQNACRALNNQVVRKRGMKIVYVVSFMPSLEGAASVGDFDWFTEEAEARSRMRSHLAADDGKPWSHDYTMRSVPVPSDLDPDEITEFLDAELREKQATPAPSSHPTKPSTTRS